MGVFITGQFFEGSAEDADYKSSDILENYSDIGLEHHEISNSLLSAKPPSGDKLQLFYEKIIKVQEDLLNFYEDAFAYNENRVRRRLINILRGRKTPYIGMGEFKNDMDSIYRKLKFVRTNLFDAATTMRNIYGLSEICVYKPLSDSRGFEPHNIVGAVLTNAPEKTQNDGSLYDRTFTYADIVLRPDMFVDEKNDFTQISDIQVENEECLKYLEYRADYIKLLMSPEKNLSANINNKDGNPNDLLLLQKDLRYLEDSFVNCLLSVHYTKGHKDFPVAFFVKYPERKVEARRNRFLDSLKSIMKLMGVTYLAQWNMLAAEYNTLRNANINMYRKHESAQVFSGIANIANIQRLFFDKNYRNINNALNNMKNIIRGIEFTHEMDKNKLFGHLDLTNELMARAKYHQTNSVTDMVDYVHLLSNLLSNVDAFAENAKLEISKFDLERLLGRLKSTYRHRGTNQDFTRKIYFHLEPLEKISGDMKKLGQIINNLIQNALKYSHKYTNINIEAGGYTNKKDMYISVTNYGNIVPLGERKKIFEMGYRGGAENNEYEPVTGSGLGLYIAKTFANMHNGDLILEEPEFLSELNIPLLKGYLNSGTYKHPLDPEIEKKCKEELEKLENSRQYNEVVIGNYKPSGQRTESKAKYYRTFISNPTYKVTFTLKLPIEYIKEE